MRARNTLTFSPLANKTILCFNINEFILYFLSIYYETIQIESSICLPKIHGVIYHEVRRSYCSLST